ncbi:eukaryotic translation initiation factor 4 gamma 1-like [Diretmus argenteus]
MPGNQPASQPTSQDAFEEEGVVEASPELVHIPPTSFKGNMSPCLLAEAPEGQGPTAAPTAPEEAGGARSSMRYDRDFLLGLQFSSASMNKPEGLPAISGVVRDKANKTPLRQLNPSRPAKHIAHRGTDRFDRRDDRDWNRLAVSKHSFSREKQERSRDREHRAPTVWRSADPGRQVASMTDERDRGSKENVKPETALTPPPPQTPTKPALTEEELEKKSTAIIEEYLHINDMKEALQSPEGQGPTAAPTAPEEAGGARSSMQYDRDFLLGLQFSSASMNKPEGLPAISGVTLDKANKTPLRQLNPSHPAILSSPHRSQLGQRKEPRKVIASMSLNGDVQLNKAEKAWKTMKRVTKNDEEPAKTQELFKRLRAILNKLTPEMFVRLMKQVTELPIDTEERLKGVIDLIYEKSISEPNFSVTYANMCRCLRGLRVPRTDKPGVTVNFHKLLLNRCQKEFEKVMADAEIFEKKQKQLDAASGNEEKQHLNDELKDAKNQARRRSLGNIRLIGELFKLDMMTDVTMHDCIARLFNNYDEESLECLCRLLCTIGKGLDIEKAKPRMDQYFIQLEKILKERKTSSRICFMLQDMQDLRSNNWEPRRRDQGPKTIEQIHKEAEQEEHREQMKFQQAFISKKESSGGSVGRMDRGRHVVLGDSHTSGWRSAPLDEGWNIADISTKNRPIDTSHLSNQGPEIIDQIHKQAEQEEHRDQMKFQQAFISKKESSGGSVGRMGRGHGVLGGSQTSGWRSASLDEGWNILDISTKNRPIGGSQTSAWQTVPLDEDWNIVDISTKNRPIGGSQTSAWRTVPLDEDWNIVHIVHRGTDRFDRRGDRDWNRLAVSKHSFSREKQERSRDREHRAPTVWRSADPGRQVASMTDERDRGSKENVKPETALTPPPPQTPTKPALTEEELEKKSTAIIEEYLHINDMKEALQCVQELNSTQLLFVFVQTGLLSTLDRSTIAREHMGLLLHELIKAGSLPVQQYYQGLQEILEMAEDMAVDIPHIWLYLAELITPMLHDGGIPMAELFREISKPLIPLGKAEVLLVQIHTLLGKGMSHEKAGTIWRDYSTLPRTSSAG